MLLLHIPYIITDQSPSLHTGRMMVRIHVSHPYGFGINHNDFGEHHQNWLQSLLQKETDLTKILLKRSNNKQTHLSLTRFVSSFFILSFSRYHVQHMMIICYEGVLKTWGCIEVKNQRS